SGRRACLLDLGNECVTTGGDPPLDGLQKATRSRGRFRRGFDIRIRADALGGGDFVSLVRLDLFEDVGHCAFDTAISRSSRPSASPVSIERVAIAAPSLRSSARPETTSAAAALRIAISR